MYTSFGTQTSRYKQNVFRYVQNVFMHLFAMYNDLFIMLLDRLLRLHCDLSCPNISLCGIQYNRCLHN